MPVQALCMAIFDAILVHIVTTCSADGTWLRLKRQMLQALYAKKDARIAQILTQTYAEADALFLQVRVRVRVRVRDVDVAQSI